MKKYIKPFLSKLRSVAKTEGLSHNIWILFLMVSILPYASVAAEPRYRIVSSGQLGSLEDRGGSLMASLVSTEIEFGSRRIVGFRVDQVQNNSVLMLTSIESGDSIFAINGLAFYSTADFSSYIKSLTLPGEVLVSYVDADKGGKLVDAYVREITLSEGEWKRRKNMAARIASSFDEFYDCSHLSSDEYLGFMEIVGRMLPSQPGVMSVRNQIYEKMFISSSEDLNIKVGKRAKENICVKRSASADEIRAAQTQAEVLAKCSLIASYNAVVARQLNEDESIAAWEKANFERATALGGQAINVLRAVGRDGSKWWERVSSPSLIEGGNKLIPNVQVRQQVESDCIRRGLLLEIGKFRF